MKKNNLVYGHRLSDKARVRIQIFKFMVKNAFYCVACNTKRYFYTLVKIAEFKEKKGEYFLTQLQRDKLSLKSELNNYWETW